MTVNNASIVKCIQRRKHRVAYIGAIIGVAPAAAVDAIIGWSWRNVKIMPYYGGQRNVIFEKRIKAWRLMTKAVAGCVAVKPAQTRHRLQHRPAASVRPSSWQPENNLQPGNICGGKRLVKTS